MGRLPMAQEAINVALTLVDPPAVPAWIELAGRLAQRPPREGDELGAAAGPLVDGDVDYYCARAEAETARAAEAVHPAARRAHLEMAAQYRQRVLAARQVEGCCDREWMPEVAE